MYVTAGDPSLSRSLEILHLLVDAGVDIIEVGFPFSDPILDGPVIQQANRRALNSGGSLQATLNLVREFRKSDNISPIILMGYYNPIYAMGPKQFAIAAASSGVDGVIVADLPLQESLEDLLPYLAERGLVQIPLSSPPLPATDIITERPGLGGFLYCVPIVGPTGGAAASIETISLEVARCRKMTNLPVGVGFGVKTPAAAGDISMVADAVIIGNALVASIANWQNEGKTSRECDQQLREFVGGFRAAMDTSRLAD